MRWKVEFLARDPVEELIEKGKEERARIVREVFKLHEKEQELGGQLEKEISELLKRIDEEDVVIHSSIAPEGDGLEYWTRRGRLIFVGKDGSIAVQARNGTYIIGQRAFLL